MTFLMVFTDLHLKKKKQDAEITSFLKKFTGLYYVSL